MTLALGGLTLGFVGTGTITEAVVTGLSRTKFRDNRIVVSPRNETVAKKLAAAYENVEVATDNQDVLDRADLAFLAVRPQIVEEVVRSLRFRRDHHIVSFVAATPLDRLMEWVDERPACLSQAIPLPFVADLQGATAIYPPDEKAAAIFSALGTSAQVASKHEYDLLAGASSLMGTYFGILDATSGWLERNGLPKPVGDAYLRQLFAGLAFAGSARSGLSFDALVEGHSTKGGLNEQVLADFTGNGGLRALSEALDAVMVRIAPDNKK
ncbi:pyrroline-5-carboxylate reductase [Rhizobium sp. Root1220]|uniref:pyrroline-5-carboxylate reductase n=1 Tax=Rhizobium sp. Root1220 TaxID=1736432 RepID=UPI0006FC7881|nr:pyrroline-5-carboxylate reductase [Rhizobium sp. Root1220]KQV64387.1 pyrroline-5-carboxylate reductase [Rhizobium sp. Root1220]